MYCGVHVKKKNEQQNTNIAAIYTASIHYTVQRDWVQPVHTAAVYTYMYMYIHLKLFFIWVQKVLSSEVSSWRTFHDGRVGYLY